MGNNRKILHGVSVAILLLFVFLAMGSTGTTPANTSENRQSATTSSERTPVNTQDANTYFERGTDYLKKREYDQAITEFTQVIRILPREVAGYNNRGLAYFRKGDYDKAIADYEAALRIDPNYTIVKENLELAQQAKANARFTGDGGRSIRLAVLAPAGTGLSRDEQWILSHIQGAITGNINKYSAITVQASTANATHILASSLSKAQSGYTLELAVTDAASGEKVFTYPPTQITQDEIETLSAINTASADLLGQMGVNLTARGQQILAQAHSQDDFEIRQNTDNTLTITGYKGAIKDVVIPGTLYGLKVTVIGGEAFHNKDITSVVIPDTVITINNGREEPFQHVTILNIKSAFSSNKQLSKVTLGNGLTTIGDHAFYDTKITEITIPDSVTTIGERAFRSSGLSKVTFGTGLQTIGRRAFYGNQITELELPSSLKEIGESAFESNQIQKIVFGTGLQTISFEAFKNNQIAELNLPSSVKIIRGGAFANNKIQSLVIPNGVTHISRTRDHSGHRYTGSPRGVFEQNPLTSVVIPASLVAEDAFDGGGAFGERNGSTITHITIPAGMTRGTIGGLFEEAFVNFWISQNNAGGTYVKRGPIWTRE